MAVNVPAVVRFALYAFTAVGTPVVTYLYGKGYIGDLETALWGAEVTVVSALAAAKTNISGEDAAVS